MQAGGQWAKRPGTRKSVVCLRDTVNFACQAELERVEGMGWDWVAIQSRLGKNLAVRQVEVGCVVWAREKT